MASHVGAGAQRRGFLRATAAGAVAGLAGCTGLLDRGPAPLEIQHYWTGGDGSTAMAALLDGFRDRHPGVEVVENPIAGGAAENMQDVVRKRVLNGNPPSTWQAWPGANLRPYLEKGVLVDIGERVWDHDDMRSAYREGPKRAARPDGDFVAVPINIHRINNLFYNVAVLESAGVDPDSIQSPGSLLSAMDRVEAETSALGTIKQTRAPWSIAQLCEDLILALAGPSGYRETVSGRPDRGTVRKALSLSARFLEHTPTDSRELTWTDANRRFIDGEAAFFVQGDWAAGMYRDADDFEFGRDWGHRPFPGTAGAYLHNMDSFPFPADNPSSETTAAFLRYCGSVDAQELFNPHKGSIPPRDDVPDDSFGPLLTRQMADFGESVHLQSAAHGLALPPATKADVDEVFERFLDDRDVDRAADGLVGALRK